MQLWKARIKNGNIRAGGRYRGRSSSRCARRRKKCGREGRRRRGVCHGGGRAKVTHPMQLSGFIYVFIAHNVTSSCSKY